MARGGVTHAARSVLVLGVLVCAAIHETHASNFMRWSSYTPKPVSQPCAAARNASKVPSSLWGCNGEMYNSSGPLTDFAFAGYGAGMEKIPDLPVTVDVKRDFRAAGDGKKDDTAAVLAALKATQEAGGVIYFPPGKYLLNNQLNLTSNQVLRGAGRDATNLYFNTSLQQLHGWGPHWTAGMEKSPFTWAGGLISTQREKRLFDAQSLYLANLTRPAARGDTRLYLGFYRDDKKRADQLIVPGQWMSLTMLETPKAELAKHLINNRTEPGNRLGPDFGNRQMFTHMTRVTGVGPDWVEIERPLHVDVSLLFKPTVYRSSNFKVAGVGVEDLQIEFPWTPYWGTTRPGYNAIEYEAAVNSWVRRIYSSIFNTVSDVEFGVTPKPRRGGRWYGRNKVMQTAEKDGHMAIALHWASFDNLIEKFNITNAIFYHELLVAGYSAHNVFANGTGIDICLDHHGGAPHNNLWTDIDLVRAHNPACIPRTLPAAHLTPACAW
ncbi:hypothetical protein COO60DRAFT_1583210 [Scenedesmus sp. NREL 46B-D3]|nr:hypothetical protein COO60DRAFT_1583210 [Scenedesmus sp. NREL 46B-D3]